MKSSESESVCLAEGVNNSVSGLQGPDSLFFQSNMVVMNRKSGRLFIHLTPPAFRLDHHSLCGGGIFDMLSATTHEAGTSHRAARQLI